MWESQNTRIQNGTQIHKEGNPSQSMCSGCCHTSDISLYIDHQLQTHVREMEYNVKDLLDFIRESDSIENN